MLFLTMLLVIRFTTNFIALRKKFWSLKFCCWNIYKNRLAGTPESVIQRCIISRDSTSVSRTQVCLNPCPKFIICDNLFKRQCYENFNPVFMVLTHLGSLFICWSIFAFLYLHICTKNYAVSLTSGSFIWHRGVISNFIVITFNWFSRDSQSKKGHGGTFVHSRT